VIEAGSLKKDHALRKLVERLREAAAIECYPDSKQDLERLIDTDVRAAGLKIEPDAKAALVQSLGGDRLTTRSELDKLITYAHGAGTITREDVDLLVADAILALRPVLLETLATARAPHATFRDLVAFGSRDGDPALTEVDALAALAALARR
jgi:DNA polymerase-3 subunit delta